MANDPKDKHGFWAKSLSELYRLASKEVKSIPGQINILMMIGLLAIILAYILSSTVASVARIIAAALDPAFIDQADDNIVGLILAFVIPSGLCLLFMKFIIREEGDK